MGTSMGNLGGHTLLDQTWDRFGPKTRKRALEEEHARRAADTAYYGMSMRSYGGHKFKFCQKKLS